MNVNIASQNAICFVSGSVQASRPNLGSQAFLVELGAPVASRLAETKTELEHFSDMTMLYSSIEQKGYGISRALLSAVLTHTTHCLLSSQVPTQQ
jgi:hypothetical protein